MAESLDSEFLTILLLGKETLKSILDDLKKDLKCLKYDKLTKQIEDVLMTIRDQFKVLHDSEGKDISEANDGLVAATRTDETLHTGTLRPSHRIAGPDENLELYLTSLLTEFKYLSYRLQTQKQNHGDRGDVPYESINCGISDVISLMGEIQEICKEYWEAKQEIGRDSGYTSGRVSECIQETVFSGLEVTQMEKSAESSATRRNKNACEHDETRCNADETDVKTIQYESTNL